MVSLRKVNNLDKYYKRLNIGISMSKMWNSLQTKSEYQSEKSEKGYQQIAKSMAGTIARGLKCNDDLAECLTMCRGAFFPMYGREGKKIIMQYIKERNINISEKELAKKFIEYDLSEYGNTITPEFDLMLQELFDTENEPHTQEVKIARLCGETIDKIKSIEKHLDINKIDLLYKLTNDTEKTSIETGKPIQSKKLDELYEKVPTDNIKIEDNLIEKMYNDLDVFIKNSKENEISGICKYISTSGIEL